MPFDVFIFTVLNLNGLQRDRQIFVHAMNRTEISDEWWLAACITAA